MEKEHYFLVGHRVIPGGQDSPSSSSLIPKYEYGLLHCMSKLFAKFGYYLNVKNEFEQFASHICMRSGLICRWADLLCMTD